MISIDKTKAKRELEIKNNLKLNLPIFIKILVMKKNNKNLK